MSQNRDNIFDKPVSRQSVIMGAAAIAGGLGMSGLLPERLARAASTPAPTGAPPGPASPTTADPYRIAQLAYRNAGLAYRNAGLAHHSTRVLRFCT